MLTIGRKESKNKQLTVSDLRKMAEFKPPTQQDRIDIVRKNIENLSKKHKGYFNGKKVPYAKAQSYKQCIFNPFKNDGGMITVQCVGKFTNAELNAKREDNLSRKMTTSLKNTQHLQMKTMMDDSAVF